MSCSGCGSASRGDLAPPTPTVLMRFSTTFGRQISTDSVVCSRCAMHCRIGSIAGEMVMQIFAVLLQILLDPSRRALRVPLAFLLCIFISCSVLLSDFFFVVFWTRAASQASLWSEKKSRSRDRVP